VQQTGLKCKYPGLTATCMILSNFGENIHLHDAEVAIRKIKGWPSTLVGCLVSPRLMYFD
jgi:hypothetical protein